MDNSLIQTTSTSDFFKKLAEHQNTKEHPKPLYVRLEGKKGIWEEKNFDQIQKKSINTPFQGGDEWTGAILFVKWFAKDAYEEGAKTTKRTREFSSFRDEPIEWMEIDFANQENTKTLATYSSYDVFKEEMQKEYGNAVNEALKAKSAIPDQKKFKPELWGSIYIYSFELDRIVNVKVKGKSRSALFDYLGSWRRGLDQNADSISQVLTRFGSVHMTEPQEYYAVKFSADCVLSEPHQEKVKEAVIATMSWMRSFKEDPVVEEVKAISVDEPPF